MLVFPLSKQSGHPRPVSPGRKEKIRGVNRAEEGWADKKESWRKEEEMEE